MIESGKAIIDARSIHFQYDGVNALRGVDLKAKKGEMLGVIGPNGAGKSTLLKILAGLLHPGRGEIYISGEPIKKITRKELARILAWIPQSETREVPLTVSEIVSLGRYPHRKGILGLSERDKEAIKDSLLKTNMWDLKDRLFFELSGGEAQRAILARALAQEPEVLLLDEPTSHLDLRHRISFGKLVRDLVKKEGKTAIWVSHDLNLAARFSEKLILLDKGKVVASGPVEEVLKEEILQEVYKIRVKVLRPPITKFPIVVPL